MFPSRVLGSQFPSPPRYSILVLVYSRFVAPCGVFVAETPGVAGFRVIISSLPFPLLPIIRRSGWEPVRPFSPSPARGPASSFALPPRISSCREKTRLSFSRSQWRRWHLPQHTTRIVLGSCRVGVVWTLWILRVLIGTRDPPAILNTTKAIMFQALVLVQAPRNDLPGPIMIMHARTR